jgi:hypothetical protein
MKYDIQSWLLAVLLSLAVLSVPFLMFVARSSDKPEILILSEKFVQGYAGETLLFVDYTVGGIATNATFREHQMDKYNSLMEHLKKTGRVSR